MVKKSLIRLLFALLFLFPGSTSGQDNEYDVPYVPSKTEVVAEMLNPPNIFGRLGIGCLRK